MKPSSILLAALVCVSAFGVSAPTFAQAPAPAPTTFLNPIRTDFGADPYLLQKDGFYYFTATAGNSIQIIKAKTLAEIATAPRITVWKSAETGPTSRDVWAPEIHFLRGKWFIYFTATSDVDKDINRRIFALEAATGDPQGRYIERGQIRVPGADSYAIDGTIFEWKNGQLFFLYSGREDNSRSQNIFIAPMSDPLTISGPRVKLSAPTLGWERVGWAVNEGPEVLERGGKTHIIYSASGGTTPDYALGLLSNATDDLLNPAAWEKSQIPVFKSYDGPDGVVYTPGHNGFFKSPDGTEDWIVYHGKENTDNTWNGRRARAQKFTWNADNTPNFGFPIPAFKPLAVPSGETGSVAEKRGLGTGLSAEYFVYQGSTPNFDTSRGIETGQNIDFDARLGSPSPKVGADRFAIRWRGQIQPRVSGIYGFQTYADDGVRVKIDGETIIDNFKITSATGSRGYKTLEAGKKVSIEVEYFEFDGPARCSLYWQSEKQPFQVIPRDVLFAPQP